MRNVLLGVSYFSRLVEALNSEVGERPCNVAAFRPSTAGCGPLISYVQSWMGPLRRSLSATAK